MKRNLTVVLRYALVFLATFVIGLAVSRLAINNHHVADSVTLTYKLTEFENGAPVSQSQSTYSMNRHGEWTCTQTLPDGRVQGCGARAELRPMNLRGATISTSGAELQ